MQTIVQIKDGLWSNLATMAFLLSLAAFAVWLNHRVGGGVNPIMWVFSGIMLLTCYFPIESIRRPKSRLLAFDNFELLWRIYNGRTGQVTLEKRVQLSSIHALKWVVPPPANCQRGKDYSNARLMFVTAERNSHTLPSEFFPAAYRRKIEAAFKKKVPGIKILEEFESA